MQIEIKKILGDIYTLKHPKLKFKPGETYITSSGQSIDKLEALSMIDFILEDTPVAGGKYTPLFEKSLARFVGTRHAAVCNSGSSANLLAIMALTSHLLGSRALKPGDEIITTAVGFPTTVNPILQAGCVPVFVDVSLSTYNTTLHMISDAITEKTKAIFIAHTLGNPYEVAEIKDLAEDNNLWLIEDCADALGAKYEDRSVGTFGHLSTTSFYPAHMITTIEGGAVFTSNPLLDKIVRSFRDWGRDCWCLPGKDNTCGKRFTQKNQGELPDGYDHKYTYSHIGYNLKMTDIQAVMGLAQLKKLPIFLERRAHNWELLWKELETPTDGVDVKDYIQLPQHLPKAQPAWFGFVLLIKNGAKFTVTELAQYLENAKIGSRPVFAGNITRQPAYLGKGRISDSLFKSDKVMKDALWIGVHPSIDDSMVRYMALKIRDFIREKNG